MEPNKFLQILIVAIIFCAQVALAQETGTPAQRIFSKGLALEKSSPEVAFQHYMKSVALAKGSDKGLFYKALAKSDSLGYMLGGDHELEAFRILRKEIKLLGTNYPKDIVTSDLFYWAGLWYKELVTVPDSSISCLEKALDIRRGLLGDRKEKVAACYQGLGEVYKYSLRDFDAAEKYYEKALAIRETVKPVNKFELARTYYGLAAVNRSQRDFEKALSYGFRTIDLVKQINRPAFLESTYSIVGNIYRDINQFDSARNLYKLAIASNRKFNGGKPNERLAAFYQGLGEILKREARYEEAIASYDQALAIFSQVTVSDRNIFVHSLQQLGEIHVILNHEAIAARLYNRARRLIVDSRLLKSGSAAELYRCIGDLFLKESHPDSALFYYQKSLVSGVRDFNSMNSADNPVASSIELSSFVYEALLAKAEVLMHLFRVTNNYDLARNALRCYGLAEKVLAGARNMLDMQEAKWAYLDENFGLYDKSVGTVDELLQSSTRPEASVASDSLFQMAYHYIEASKSRSLADALHTAEYSNSAVLSDPLLRERNSYQAALLTLQDQLKQTDQSDKTKVTRDAIVDLDRKMKRNEVEVRKKYPSYLDVKHEYRLPSMADVQEFARRQDALLLEYFWGNQFVYAFGITGDTVVFKKIAAVDTLAYWIKALMGSLQPEHPVIDSGAYRMFSQSSFELNRLLMNPFRTLTTKKTRIVVIPDGLIGQVPFEVLIDAPAKSATVNYSNLSYLINLHIVNYTFSAALLLRQRPEAISKPGMLAYGLTGGSIRSGPDTGSSVGAAAFELASLSKLFPTGRFYLGDQATEESFKTKAPEYDFLHLAIHGRGDTEKNYAASLFFKTSNDSTNDGELHWYELYGMRLKALLTVLSSCESGIGKSYKGEGMLSMANAFVYSGCHNVVLGLWKVNDQVSVQLMGTFYELILKGKRMDEALRDAKLHYLAGADEFSAHPKLWGALVAYGDQQVIKQDESRWLFVSIAIASIACLAFVVRVYRKSARWR